MTQSPPEKLDENQEVEEVQTFDATDMYSDVSYELRIPKARIAVLIGSKGETKKRIEQDTNTKLDIDSAEGEVTIIGSDVITSYVVKDIVKAIGRGFNPEIALQLLKPEYSFELIEMTELAKHKNQLARVKGRIIGKAGKTREIIEKLMDVSISVFGKTVGILGPIERVTAAKQAVDMILDGSPHANVYRWLEKKKKSFTRDELIGNNHIEFKEGMDKYR